MYFYQLNLIHWVFEFINSTHHFFCPEWCLQAAMFSWFERGGLTDLKLIRLIRWVFHNLNVLPLIWNDLLCWHFAKANVRIPCCSLHQNRTPQECWAWGTSSQVKHLLAKATTEKLDTIRPLEHLLFHNARKHLNMCVQMLLKRKL